MSSSCSCSLGPTKAVVVNVFDSPGFAWDWDSSFGPQSGFTFTDNWGSPLSFENADLDGDGIPTVSDNCTTRSNGTQVDSNGDTIGNACDADLNNDCFVNLEDLIEFKSGFFPVNDPDADFNDDGFVNVDDLVRFKALYFQVPGPSASGICD